MAGSRVELDNERAMIALRNAAKVAAPRRQGELTRFRHLVDDRQGKTPTFRAPDGSSHYM